MKQYIILAALSQSLEYQAISDKTREGKVFCISVYVSLHMSISLFDIWLLQRLYNVACSRYLLLQILEITLAVCINLLYHVALLVIQQHFIIYIFFEYPFNCVLHLLIL